MKAPCGNRTIVARLSQNRALLNRKTKEQSTIAAILKESFDPGGDRESSRL
jgi:hypothetical protein